MQYRERTVEAIQWHPGVQIPGLVEVAAVDVREPFWRGTIACHGIVPLPLPHGGWLRVEDGTTSSGCLVGSGECCRLRSSSSGTNG